MYYLDHSYIETETQLKIDQLRGYHIKIKILSYPIISPRVAYYWTWKTRALIPGNALQ